MCSLIMIYHLSLLTFICVFINTVLGEEMNWDEFRFGVDAKNISSFIDKQVQDTLKVYNERMQNQTKLKR